MVGPTGAASTVAGPTGPAGVVAAGGLVYRFFVQDGNTPKIINITNDDLNKIWFIWLGNAAINIRLPNNLVETGGVQTSGFHMSAWATVVVLNNGTSAELQRADGSSMFIPFSGSQISTLTFLRNSIGANPTGNVSVNRSFWNFNGTSSSSLP
jgi:hypothetical protein